MKFASTLPEVAKAAEKLDRFTLAFAFISAALVALVAYIVHDVHKAQEQARQICEESVRGLDLVGEMQYQIQEARRSMLYALATTNPNQQVQYADQSRASDADVAKLFGQSATMAIAPGLSPAIRQLRTDWSQYLTNRDEVIAAILEGDPRRGVELDLEAGVPAFNRVRDDLQRLRGHFNDQAQQRLGEVKLLFRVSIWKFALSLCLTLVFAAFAVKIVQRDKMLSVVQASENRLNELIRSINEGMMVVNPEGGVELWNHAATQSTGLRAADLLGRPLVEIFPASASAALQQAVGHCASTGLCSTVTGLALLGPGSRRVFEARVFPFEHGTTVFFNDVTDSTHALRELKAAKDEAEASAQAREELIRAISGKVGNAMQGLLAQLPSSAESSALRIEAGVARDLRQQIMGVLETVGTLATGSDLTPGLSKARNSAEDIFVPVLEFSVSAEGRVLSASPECGQVLGCAAEGLMTGPDAFALMIHEDDRSAWLEQLRRACDGGMRAVSQFRLRDGRGALRWIEQVIERTPEGVGGLVTLRGCARDITERKVTELQNQKILEDVAHLTRVAATGELAASIAHELNQPLTAILANAQATRRILAREPADLLEVKAALEDIIGDTQRAGEVIRRLRLLFRRSHLERNPIDVNELVWDTVRLLKTEMQLQDVVTRIDLSAGLHAVPGDRVQLQQVILNLMINAIDVLSNLTQQSRLIHVSSAPEHPRTVRVSIRDNGPGVDEGVMAQLFTPFFTTKKGGMGMGLSVARSIIEGHGGKLWVTNPPGGGAAFHFLLPVGEGEAGA